MRIGFAQDRVQRRDDRHAQIAQQRQDVAAGPAAKNAVFELQADQVDAVDIQKIGGAAIRLEVFFRQFEAHPRRIGVAAFDVVDRHGDAGRVAMLGGDRFAQVGGKRGDAALARQVVADKGDAIDRGIFKTLCQRKSSPSWR